MHTQVWEPLLENRNLWSQLSSTSWSIVLKHTVEPSFYLVSVQDHQCFLAVRFPLSLAIKWNHQCRSGLPILCVISTLFCTFHWLIAPCVDLSHLIQIETSTHLYFISHILLNRRKATSNVFLPLLITINKNTKQILSLPLFCI